MSKDYGKLFVALRYYLIGKEYHLALKALNFARQLHTGTRKDGVTPEFQHQIEIALYISTLKNIHDEELALAAALLHDVMEDFDIPEAEMIENFGAHLTAIISTLSKKYRGVNKDLGKYFLDIGNCIVSSVVKGADRIHNVQSMIGVFTVDKQKQYLDEVENHFLPMLKRAKYNFPSQTQAYFNIIHMLKSQSELIHAVHNA